MRDEKEKQKINVVKNNNIDITLTIGRTKTLLELDFLLIHQK